VYVIQPRTLAGRLFLGTKQFMEFLIVDGNPDVPNSRSPGKNLQPIIPSLSATFDIDLIVPPGTIRM
jgi:hypothetical protein